MVAPPPRGSGLIAKAPRQVLAHEAAARSWLEAAKLVLEQSRLPIEVIAREVGFANRERMRLAFARVHGEVPRAIRNDAGPLAAL